MFLSLWADCLLNIDLAIYVVSKDDIVTCFNLNGGKVSSSENVDLVPVPWDLEPGNVQVSSL